MKNFSFGELADEVDPADDPVEFAVLFVAVELPFAEVFAGVPPDPIPVMYACTSAAGAMLGIMGYALSSQ
jgi:hypothetical protein